MNAESEKSVNQLRKIMDEGDELISGHRRTHAAKRAGLTSVPAVIRNLSDDEATVLIARPYELIN